VTFRNIGPLKPHNISEKNIGNGKLQRFFSGGIPYGKNKQFFLKRCYDLKPGKSAFALKGKFPMI